MGKDKSPRVVITLDENTNAITVKMRKPERINARILQRMIREIQRQRKVELKKLIYKEKLEPKNYEQKFGKEEEDEGREEEGPGREAREAGGESTEVSRLADEIAGKL